MAASSVPGSGNSAAEQSSPPATPSYPLSLRWRIIISVLLAAHLFIVGLYPFTSRPASTFAMAVYSVPAVRHYPELIYADHAYKFFAPNPGTESRQVRWTLKTQDGQDVEGIFPHKDQNWPRLMYHRHFMLAEHLPVLSEDFVASYARHLLLTHNGDRVTLYERRSLVPLLESAQQGMTLGDASLIREASMGEFSRDDFADIANDSVLVRDLPPSSPAAPRVSSR